MLNTVWYISKSDRLFDQYTPISLIWTIFPPNCHSIHSHRLSPGLRLYARARILLPLELDLVSLIGWIENGAIEFCTRVLMVRKRGRITKVICHTADTRYTTIETNAIARTVNNEIIIYDALFTFLSNETARETNKKKNDYRCDTSEIYLKWLVYTCLLPLCYESDSIKCLAQFTSCEIVSLLN